MAIIDGLLTAVGGWTVDNKITNELVSLTGNGSGRTWTEILPPMPTKRWHVSALCTGTALIVAGGDVDDTCTKKLKTIEVMNIKTRQWHTTPDLPQPLAHSSLKLCRNLIYLLGGVSEIRLTSSVYSCSLSSLLSSVGSKSLATGHLITQSAKESHMQIWNKVADIPMNSTAAVVLHGQLLIIGGSPSTAVHMYQPNTNSWEVISHMTTPRSNCLAAVLPDNQLMVVGGQNIDNHMCNIVEFGKVLSNP